MSITSSGDIAPAVAPLVARTVALDGPSADLALLTAIPSHDALAWIRHGEGIVGWGEVTRITTHGAARFSQAAQWWRELSEHAIVRDEVNLPGTGPIAFGTFAFADHSESESTLVVPRWCWAVRATPPGSRPLVRRRTWPAVWTSRPAR